MQNSGRSASIAPVPKGETTDHDVHKSQKGTDVVQVKLKNEKRMPEPDYSDEKKEGCCQNACVNAIKAMITRALFLLHSLMAIWRVTVVTAAMYWLLTLSFVGLLTETIVVIISRKGQEWRW